MPGASRGLRRALLALGATAVAAVGAGLLLPRSWEVERSVVIDAPAVAIHARLADLSAWRGWSPWIAGDDAGDDARVELRFSGAAQGVDAAMSWSGPSGSGALRLTASDPELGVWYDLVEGGRHRAKGALRTLPAERGTRVVWSQRGELGANPAARWLGPWLARRFGSQLERGLARLARVCEAER